MVRDHSFCYLLVGNVLVVRVLESFLSLINQTPISLITSLPSF